MDVFGEDTLPGDQNGSVCPFSNRLCSSFSSDGRPLGTTGQLASNPLHNFGCLYVRSGRIHVYPEAEYSISELTGSPHYRHLLCMEIQAVDSADPHNLASLAPTPGSSTPFTNASDRVTQFRTANGANVCRVTKLLNFCGTSEIESSGVSHTGSGLLHVGHVVPTSALQYWLILKDLLQTGRSLFDTNVCDSNQSATVQWWPSFESACDFLVSGRELVPLRFVNFTRDRSEFCDAIARIATEMCINFACFHKFAALKRGRLFRRKECKPGFCRIATGLDVRHLGLATYVLYGKNGLLHDLRCVTEDEKTNEWCDMVETVVDEMARMARETEDGGSNDPYGFTSVGSTSNIRRRLPPNIMKAKKLWLESMTFVWQDRLSNCLSEYVESRNLTSSRWYDVDTLASSNTLTSNRYDDYVHKNNKRAAKRRLCHTQDDETRR